MYLIKFTNKEPEFDAPISSVNNRIIKYLNSHYGPAEVEQLLHEYFESYRAATGDEWGISNIVTVKRWDT